MANPKSQIPNPKSSQPSTLAHAKPFLNWLLILGVVSALFHLVWITLVCAMLIVYILYFFRVPAIRLPANPAAIVAPASGTVTDILECEEPHFIKGRAQRIGIFLSIFDVHVQRSPTDGVIKWADYRPGQFLDARDTESSDRNECQWLGFEAKDRFRYTVKLIAGLIARRIVLWQPKEKPIQRGDLISLIRFGSRVEIFLPKGTPLDIKVGDRVNAGETIVAQR
jgi:phosphatidylserine decarboxylase